MKGCHKCKLLPQRGAAYETSPCATCGEAEALKGAGRDMALFGDAPEDGEKKRMRES